MRQEVPELGKLIEGKRGAMPFISPSLPRVLVRGYDQASASFCMRALLLVDRRY